jgi:hypothetical protein
VFGVNTVTTGLFCMLPLVAKSKLQVPLEALFEQLMCDGFLQRGMFEQLTFFTLALPLPILQEIGCNSLYPLLKLVPAGSRPIVNVCISRIGSSFSSFLPTAEGNSFRFFPF